MQTSGESGLTFLQRLGRWLGLEGNLIILLIAVLAIGAGEELWMPAAALGILGTLIYAIRRNNLSSIQWTKEDRIH